MACIMMGLQAQCCKEVPILPGETNTIMLLPLNKLPKKQKIHARESLYLWRPSSSKFQWDQSLSVLVYKYISRGQFWLLIATHTSYCCGNGKSSPTFQLKCTPGQLWNPTWRERNFILAPFGNEHKGQPGLQRKCQRGGSSEKIQPT